MKVRELLTAEEIPPEFVFRRKKSSCAQATPTNVGKSFALRKKFREIGQKAEKHCAQLKKSRQKIEIRGKSRVVRKNRVADG